MPQDACYRVAMRITFDTNALDKAVRPERCPGIHQALISGSLKGFFSDTIITLEAVENSARVQVFGATRSVTKVNPSEDGSRIEITHTVEQSRKPLQAGGGNLARVQAALQLGMRALRAPPRVGAPRLHDPQDEIYEPDGSTAQLIECQDRFSAIVVAIEARGVGHAKVRLLEEKFAKRHGGPKGTWLTSLRFAQDDNERTAVNRAIAEWADGDAVAAHYAYQNDYLCSDDFGGDSVFDRQNRSWLEDTYGIRFVRLSELAAMVP
jgi:hypothetical protein